MPQINSKPTLQKEIPILKKIVDKLFKGNYEKETMKKKPIKKGILKGRDEQGRFIKGVYKGGPGRTKGSISIVNRAKEILRREPERLEELAKDLLENEKLRLELIRQIDGMPKQSQDVNLSGSVEIKKLQNDIGKILKK